MKVVLGVIVHFILLLSIFEIYFRSPIVPVEKAYEQSIQAPAKRVVFIVIDGLRASIFYKVPTLVVSHALFPYFYQSICFHSARGICQTRVPTETRPGHVAIFGGFYEDPSAVTKGWTENPVDFDTVFNRSQKSYAWGSPDILNIFSKVGSDKLEYHAYGPELEDFYSDSAFLTDEWVFTELSKFFLNAKSNHSYYKELHGVKHIFFVHLLSTDTSGHVHKPKSAQYIENIHYVDKELIKMLQKFENFFHFDNLTTYVLTSDHGMTDWGSHGAGSDHETHVPIVAWGAGIRSGEKYDFIRQADMTPFISTLVGIPIPVNSVGILPGEYLSLDTCDLARAYWTNMKQINELYKTKVTIIERSLFRLFNMPFGKLTVSHAENQIEEIDQLIQMDKCLIAKNNSISTMRILLEGIEYYDNFFQLLLLIFVTMSIVLWSFYLFQYALHQFTLCNRRNVATGDQSIKKWDVFRMDVVNYMIEMVIKGRVPICVSIILSLLIYAQKLPFIFYIYGNMPFILSALVLTDIDQIYNSYLKSNRTALTKEFCIQLMMIYPICIVLLVYSFFNRNALTLLLFVVMMWRYFILQCTKSDYSLISIWFASGFILSIFPLLPDIEFNRNPGFIFYGAATWIVYSVLIRSFLPHLVLGRSGLLLYDLVNTMQIFLIIITALVTYECRFPILDLFKTTNTLRVLGWLISVSSFILLFFTSNSIIPRLHGITFGIIPALMLMSGTYELIFLLILMIHLLCWIAIENIHSDGFYGVDLVGADFELNDYLVMTSTPRISDEFRCSFTFLFYFILSFFGTGDVASLNSFDPKDITCLVAVFSPYLMSILLLLKKFIPFLIVSAVFRALSVVFTSPMKRMLTTSVIFSNLMSVYFLFQVKNTGSWLEIGTSISHYIIIQTMILLVIVLSLIGKILTRPVVMEPEHRQSFLPDRPHML